MIETLYCTAGQHSWARERKRGRKPEACPEHRGELSPLPAPETAPSLDAELVELYMSDTLQSEHIVRAFLADDVEPPHRDVTDQIGFTFAQTEILDKAASKLPSA